MPGRIDPSADQVQKRQLDSASEKSYQRELHGFSSAQIAQTEFTAGVIGADVYGRIDNALFEKALAYAHNCVIKTQGSVASRPGTLFGAYAGRVRKPQRERDTRLIAYEPTDELSLLCYIAPQENDLLVQDGYYARFFERNATGTLDPVMWNKVPNITGVTYVDPVTTRFSTDEPLRFMEGADVYISGMSGADEFNDRTVTARRVLLSGYSGCVVSKTGWRTDFTSAGHGLVGGESIIFRCTDPSANNGRWRAITCGTVFGVSVVDVNRFIVRYENKAQQEFLTTWHWAVEAGLLQWAVVDDTKFDVIETNSGYAAWMSDGITQFKLEVPVPIPPMSILDSHYASTDRSLLFTSRLHPPFELTYTLADVDPALATFQFQFDWYLSLSRRRATTLLYNVPTYEAAPSPIVEGASPLKGTTPTYTYRYHVTYEYLTRFESHAASIVIGQNAPLDGTSGTHILLSWRVPDTGVTGSVYRVYRYDPETGEYRHIQTIDWLAGPTFTDDKPNPWYTEETTGPTPVETTDKQTYRVSPGAEVPLFYAADDWPGSIAYADQRLAIGATPADPDVVFLSKVGSYSTFTTIDPLSLEPIRDDDAMKLRAFASGVQDIRAIAVLQDLLLMTAKAEVRLGPADAGSALTPATASARPQSYYGSSRLQPLTCEDSVFYRREGDIIRAIRYRADGLAGASYGSTEVSVLAQRLLLRRTIKRWTWAPAPRSEVWMVLSDGTAITITFSREHSIVAFTTHSMSGKALIHDVSYISPNGIGSVVLNVLRFLNGTWQDCIEVLTDRDHGSDVAQCYYLDCGVRSVKSLEIVYSKNLALEWVFDFAPGHGMVDGDLIDITGVGPPDPDVLNGRWELEHIAGDQFSLLYPGTTTELSGVGYGEWGSGPLNTDGSGFFNPVVSILTGLDHLEGETVTVFAGGARLSDAVVSSGSVSLGGGYSNVSVGFGYRSEFRLLPISRKAKQSTDRVAGNTKRVGSATLRVVDSLGFQVGFGDSLVQPSMRTDEAYGEPTRLKTGDLKVNLHATWDETSALSVVQDEPLPMEVAAIFMDLWIGEY